MDNKQIDLMFTNARDDWETPQALFDELNAEFNFMLDAAASDTNHKCEKYYTIADNALKQDWSKSTFVNPPYGRDLARWAEKCYVESLKGNTVVLLVPARTETAWFHDFVYGKAEIRFIRGRVKFSGYKYNAPFPSMICIYRGKNEQTTS